MVRIEELSKDKSMESKEKHKSLNNPRPKHGSAKLPDKLQIVSNNKTKYYL